MRTPLQKGEKILLVTYTSWVSLVWPVIGSLIFFAAGLWLTKYNGYLLIVSLISVIYFLTKYFEWKVNIWVVTSSRVIDESGLLKHFAKESPLEKINNVSYDQSIWGRMLNFGHVEIQTAAESGATDYFNVNHPKKLKDTITQAQADFENNRAINQASQMASAFGLKNQAASSNLTSELEKLFELKQKGILSYEEYVRAKNKLLNG
ncbi:MAG TPA: PH domain-containing protein [Puia sp.]|nr:PH domain-containing protein [Puia sp.]